MFGFGCLRIGNWNRQTSSAWQRRLDILVPRRVGGRQWHVDYTVLRFLSCGPRVRGCLVEIKIARLIMDVFTVACIASFLPRIDSLSHSALPFTLLYSSLLFYSFHHHSSLNVLRCIPLCIPSSSSSLFLVRLFNSFTINSVLPSRFPLSSSSLSLIICPPFLPRIMVTRRPVRRGKRS